MVTFLFQVCHNNVNTMKPRSILEMANKDAAAVHLGIN